MTRKDPAKIAFALFAVIASVAFFSVVLGTHLPAIAKFVLCVGDVAACGMALSLVFKLESWFGIIMLRSRKGLDLLDRLAKWNPQLWQVFSEIGMVVGYGSLAHFLIGRKDTDLKRFVLVYGAGTVLLVVFSTIIAPLAIATLLAMLTGGAEFASAGAKMQASVSQFEIAKYVFFALLVFGGIALTTTASIIVFALSVAAAVISAVAGNSVALMQASPGGVPILPGINLPFVEGIAALIVVLAVHEGMHGILARKEGLPLKSAGLVFFGFIPFGAFVDIDEKKLFKEHREKQNSVFVAGTAANFATCLIFLLLLAAVAALSEPLRLNGIYVANGTGQIPTGAMIEQINGKPIVTLLGLELKPNTVYTVKTDEGEFKRQTDAKGKLGIEYIIADRTGAFGEIRYAKGFEWVVNLMRFLALTFALNFVVAAMNLVPLPLFDGYYIMKNGVRSGKAAKVIAYIVAGAFILTLLPWIFR